MYRGQRQKGYPGDPRARECLFEGLETTIHRLKEIIQIGEIYDTVWSSTVRKTPCRWKRRIERALVDLAPIWLDDSESATSGTVLKTSCKSYVTSILSISIRASRCCQSTPCQGSLLQFQHFKISIDNLTSDGENWFYPN